MMKNQFKRRFSISKTCGEVGKWMFIGSVVVTLVGYGFALAADHTQGQMRNNNTKRN